eukprot:14960412-Heterocapsa_arctica.AAC.1
MLWTCMSKPLRAVVAVESSAMWHLSACSSAEPRTMPLQQPPVRRSSTSLEMRTTAAGVTCRVSLTSTGPMSSSIDLRASASRQSLTAA